MTNSNIKDARARRELAKRICAIRSSARRMILSPHSNDYARIFHTGYMYGSINEAKYCFYKEADWRP